MCSTRFIRLISQFFSMESFSGTSYTKKLSSASWTTMFGTIWSMFLWSMMVTKLEVEEQLVNQGCFRIWSAERRSWGSLLNRFLIKHRAFGDRPGGTENCPRRIFPNSALGSQSWKGYLPTNMVYNMTPRLQTSADRPEYVSFGLRISGLTYAGQPCLSVSWSSLSSFRM